MKNNDYTTTDLYFFKTFEKLSLQVDGKGTLGMLGQWGMASERIVRLEAAARWIGLSYRT
jgi:hypothetical protein